MMNPFTMTLFTPMGDAPTSASRKRYKNIFQEQGVSLCGIRSLRKESTSRSANDCLPISHSCTMLITELSTLWFLFLAKPLCMIILYSEVALRLNMFCRRLFLIYHTKICISKKVELRQIHGIVLYPENIPMKRGLRRCRRSRIIATSIRWLWLRFGEF